MNKLVKEDVAQFFHGGLVFERRFRERGANRDLVGQCWRCSSRYLVAAVVVVLLLAVVGQWSDALSLFLLLIEVKDVEEMTFSECSEHLTKSLFWNTVLTYIWIILNCSFIDLHCTAHWSILSFLTSADLAFLRPPSAFLALISLQAINHLPGVSQMESNVNCIYVCI